MVKVADVIVLAAPWTAEYGSDSRCGRDREDETDGDCD